MKPGGIVAGEWPILVTGASGFLGGHVARGLAEAGHRVRGLTRRAPVERTGDPAMEWVIGDLRDKLTRLRALEGIRGVVHVASWVSLGSDPRGLSRSINVEATRGLLEDAIASGVERFIYTSTLHTLAAGSQEAPADESSRWDLDRIDSPYCRSKREAEALVLSGLGGRLPAVVLCPGMILGPRDPKPTSTSLLLLMARSPVAFLPGGGIPVIDAGVAALGHRRALEFGEPGRRYALVGPYLDYTELARLVSQVTGRPQWVVPLPGAFERPLTWAAGVVDWVARGGLMEVSEAAVAGGFLQIHLKGDLADSTFGLVHPPPIVSVWEALEDAKLAGLAWGIRVRKPGSMGNAAEVKGS